MARFSSLIVCATLGAGLLACGSNGSDNGNRKPAAKDPLEVIPVDNTVSGWTVDQEHNKRPGERAMTSTSEAGTEAFIDGGAENYYQEPNMPKMFLWQNYDNTTLSAAPDGANVKVYLFQMSSPEQAKGIYTTILQRPSHSSGSGSWEATTPTLGDESRIQDTASQWWINFRQDVFYVEVLLDPSYGPPPDYTPGNADTKREAVRFAQAIASSIYQPTATIRYCGSECETKLE